MKRGRKAHGKEPDDVAVHRTVSIPRSLDDRMRKLQRELNLRDINWSDVAARAFEAELRHLELLPDEWRGRS